MKKKIPGYKYDFTFHLDGKDITMFSRKCANGKKYKRGEKINRLVTKENAKKLNKEIADSNSGKLMGKIDDVATAMQAQLNIQEYMEEQKKRLGKEDFGLGGSHDF